VRKDSEEQEVLQYLNESTPSDELKALLRMMDWCPSTVATAIANGSGSSSTSSAGTAPASQSLPRSNGSSRIVAPSGQADAGVAETMQMSFDG